jgi:hypothetical protein
MMFSPSFLLKQESGVQAPDQDQDDGLIPETRMKILAIFILEGSSIPGKRRGDSS